MKKTHIISRSGCRKRVHDFIQIVYEPVASVKGSDYAMKFVDQDGNELMPESNRRCADLMDEKNRVNRKVDVNKFLNLISNDVRQACDRCTKQKRGCDGKGLRQCVRCAARNETCLYSVRRRRFKSSSIFDSRKRKASVSFIGSNGERDDSFFSNRVPHIDLTRRCESYRAQSSFSASPAVGLVGLIENTFLNTFVRSFVSFVPIIGESDVCRVLVTQMMSINTSFRYDNALEVSSFWSAVAIGATLQGADMHYIRHYAQLSTNALDRDNMLTSTPNASSTSNVIAQVQSLILHALLCDCLGNFHGFIATAGRALQLWSSSDVGNIDLPFENEYISIKNQVSSKIYKIAFAMRFIKRQVVFNADSPAQWEMSLPVYNDFDMSLLRNLPSELVEPLKRHDVRQFLLVLEEIFVSTVYGQLLGNSKQSDIFVHKTVDLHAALIILKNVLDKESAGSSTVLRSVLLGWLGFFELQQGCSNNWYKLYSEILELYESIPGVLRWTLYAHRAESVAFIFLHNGCHSEYERIRSLHDRHAVPHGRPKLPPARLCIPSRHACGHYLCRILLKRCGILTTDDTLACFSDSKFAAFNETPLPLESRMKIACDVELHKRQQRAFYKEIAKSFFQKKKQKCRENVDIINNSSDDKHGDLAYTVPEKFINSGVGCIPISENEATENVQHLHRLANSNHEIELDDHKFQDHQQSDLQCMQSINQVMDSPITEITGPDDLSIPGDCPFDALDLLDTVFDPPPTSMPSMLHPDLFPYLWSNQNLEFLN